MASRREVNRTVSRPVFFATLQELFPELESLPHTDTLNRVLAKLDVAQLEVAHVEMLRRLICDKKFRRYLIKKCYPIAIDGTQKLVRDGQWWDEQWLERRHENAERKQVQQYVNVLEANLTFHNGLSIPLMSEFLSYSARSISQTLSRIGRLLPTTLSTEKGLIQYLVFTSDEIFSKTTPILVTVDPCSSAIVRIELADSRQAEDWKRHFECLYNNGMQAIYLVCDEGQGIRAGHAQVMSDVVHQSDTYHAIAHRLGSWTDRLEKAAYKAMGCRA
jgi:hypothetical protein